MELDQGMMRFEIMADSHNRQFKAVWQSAFAPSGDRTISVEQRR
ncbi:hypothetical protein [Pseudomonas sp. AA-38]|nr:hypothetical protein [Pseudomonas sp. AA-38]